ncbi:two component transcriptional regulator, LuxR family [Austwickia chelonae]|uniref:Putative two-component response regulator n=1 Tax=Austwickia chelonae NBRC 105200 TaxID=1184607 RepID=K6V8R9_9MICO|nr:response regulator transcription factor [Austwickia chelonae]GAB78613.1 putative two-component response regulator [Austwickia chelonae NBRC 105200]SEW34127.1 two component transcriptional regulator, LuxR family [Austwickia chelonae]
MTVRVFLVDDHPVVRAGLAALLGADPRVEVVGQAASGEEALSLVPRVRPDVVLMDLRLGAGMDGATTTGRLVSTPEAPAVLILTTYDTDTDILRAVEAGAAGYLLKDAPPEAIVSAVEAAARGETVLAPGVAERLVTALRRPQGMLSERELHVLRAVADGKANRAIARSLFISEATVKTHLVHVFDKLGVDNRTAAVTVARERGLLD